MSATLAELAARFDCELHGDSETVVDTVGTLANARSNAVTFLANDHYREQLSKTRAAAVVLDAEYQADCPVAALVTDNAYATYARIARFLHPPPAAKPGIHPSACVAEDATVSPSAEIGPHTVIGPAGVIDESVVIGPGSVLGAGVRVGAGSRLAARVSLMDGVRVGERCLLHPGVVVGSDGFGFAQEASGWLKVPQVGSVRIGDDVEIGANTTIDRGTIEDTIIEDGVKLDNLVQIAHNVHVGAHTVMAAFAGIAGSARIGKRCMIAGGTVVTGHIELCDDVFVTFHSTVTRSIRRPGRYSSTLPADEAERWRWNAGRFKRLDQLARRLRDVEQSLAARSKPENDARDD